MFGRRKQRSQHSRVVGVDLYDDGCALAVLDAAQGAPRLVATHWCAFDGVVPDEERLQAAVRKLGAEGMRTYATLKHASYSLVQLEAPDMPDEELCEAMRWRVRDLVDFPVEEAVIDVFRLPPSRRPGAPSLAYVIVARQRDVDDLVRLLTTANLHVEAVDIVEMAIRNLSMHLDAPGRPRAYLSLQPRQTVIEIVDGPQLYLSRRVLQDFDVDVDPDVLHAQMESLALEVQRSLDYFESQFALGAVDQLAVIVRSTPLFEAFYRVAKSFLTVKAERFDLDRIASEEGASPHDLGRGATAIGVAMRSLPWAA